MADIARGALGKLAASGRSGQDWRITANLPDIPLWVPQQARDVINSLALTTMRLALQEVAGRVSDKAPVSDGLLAQSFGADPANSTGGIELLGTDTVQGLNGRVFSSLPYAVVMEEGRRPGQPINRAGIDAIGLWAQRKLGLSAAEAEKAKWPIAMWIVGHGIEGKHYAAEGFEVARPRVEELFRILGDEIARAVAGGKA